MTSNNTQVGFEFSENQKNLWMISNNNPEVFYNQVLVELKMPILIEEVLSSIERIIQKHDIVSFRAYNNENYLMPIQISADKSVDYQNIEVNNPDFNKMLKEALHLPYDPFNTNPLRFCFVSDGKKVQSIYITLYALWGDSYSILFLSNELSKALTDKDKYTNQDVEEKIDYVNYSVWQNDLINNPEEEATMFWNAYTTPLRKEIEPFSNKHQNKFSPQKIQINRIEGEKYEELKAYCTQNNISMQDVLFCNYAEYLCLFSTNEIVLGYNQSKRNYKELENTLGYVSKIIPIKFQKNNTNSIVDYASNLAKQIEQIQDWEDYYTLNRKDTSTNQQTGFNYCFEFVDLVENHCGTPNNTVLSIKDVRFVQDQFLLKLSCVDYGDAISVELYFDEESYSEKSIDIIEAQLKHCFETTSVLNSDVLSSKELDVIAASNTTNKEFPYFKSILDLFELQVNQNPDNVSVINRGERLTYLELDQLSDKLATKLVTDCNVQKGNPVAILLERSEWYIVSILAVLKAGAYYIPIDQNYPTERIKLILEDSGATVLLSDIELTSDFDFIQLEVVNPTEHSIYSSKASKVNVTIEPKDIAYCIYTSGSTGKPKGCLIQHNNLLNYIQWANDYYYVKSELGNWGLITSMSFDLTVTALFTSLTRGKKITIGNEDKDIVQLLFECFNDPNIDTLKLTPSHLSLLKGLDIKNTHIKIVICGGEQLTQNQVSILEKINPNILIFNEYGPTESTVGCVVKKVNSKEKILIGKPIANTTINIVNEENQLCKIGAIGELIINGSGIAAGYLNNPQLSSEKFITNDSGDNVSYKTGDLGRWHSNGTIEFLGRRDSQVKIHGNRVELDEIEQCLLQNQNIKEALVLALENEEGEKEIVAYITSDKEQMISELRSHLFERLPNYMQPSQYIQLDKFPLTTNGKIDKNQLPDPKEISLSKRVEYCAPRNVKEQKLAAIWQEILQQDKIGIHDDFFLIGGNSLKAMTVINHIYRSFDVRIQIVDFFKAATIEKIVEEIELSMTLKELKETESNKKYDNEILL